MVRERTNKRRRRIFFSARPVPVTFDTGVSQRTAFIIIIINFNRPRVCLHYLYTRVRFHRRIIRNESRIGKKKTNVFCFSFFLENRENAVFIFIKTFVVYFFPLLFALLPIWIRACVVFIRDRILMESNFFFSEAPRGQLVPWQYNTLQWRTV